MTQTEIMEAFLLTLHAWQRAMRAWRETNYNTDAYKEALEIVKYYQYGMQFLNGLGDATLERSN